MKNKTILFPLLTGLFMLISTFTFAQTTPATQDQTVDRQATKDKADEDKQRMRSATDLKKETKSDAKVAKANAKEYKRIENDASDAAQEAKQAARTENRAQKSRVKADKQAKKAVRASEKSNSN